VGGRTGDATGADHAHDEDSDQDVARAEEASERMPPFRPNPPRVVEISATRRLTGACQASCSLKPFGGHSAKRLQRARRDDRLVIALEQSLVGATGRGAYAEEADVSPATASADFRRLLDAGLVVSGSRPQRRLRRRRGPARGGRGKGHGHAGLSD